MFLLRLAGLASYRTLGGAGVKPSSAGGNHQARVTALSRCKPQDIAVFFLGNRNI
jgi:hypothetical protein